MSEINIPASGTVVDVVTYPDGSGGTIKEIYVEYTDDGNPDVVSAYAYPVVVGAPDDEPPANASPLYPYSGSDIWVGIVFGDAACSDAIPLPSFTVAVWQGMVGMETTWSPPQSCVVQGHCYDLAY